MLEAILTVLLLILAVTFVPLFLYLRYCLRFYRVQPAILYLPHINFEIKSKDKTIEHEEIGYQTVDGQWISAWYVPYVPVAPPAEVDAPPQEAETLPAPPGPAIPGKSKGVILFCHGNSGNISQRIDSFRIFRQLGFSVFIFDYRGYGKSPGKPDEKGTYADAEGAWNWLVNERKVKPEEIIIFGRSLGGGIASYLASKHPPRALILESAFTSVPDMASTLFPGLPLKLLTRYKYDTRKRLRGLHCPILIIHSPDDRTIPFSHGQKLFEAANPPKKFLRITGDHLYGFLGKSGIYIEGLRDFLWELPEPFLNAEVVENRLSPSQNL
jgi:pimeloyl-ACP methyl ester carboxylesterase